jgi:hypothetical protein
VAETGQVLCDPWEARTRLGLSSIMEVARNVPCTVAERVSFGTNFAASKIKGLTVSNVYPKMQA